MLTIRAISHATHSIRISICTATSISHHDIATAAAGTITAATPVPESPSAAPTAAVTIVVAIVLGGCFTAWFAGFGPALSRCPALA